MSTADSPARSRSQRTLSLTAPILLLGTALAVLLARFFYPRGLALSFFTDDFFYYAVVARHLACCGESTFNGLQATNGYHPLWELLLTGLAWVFVSGTSFLVAVVTTIWLLVLATYCTIRSIQRELPGSRELKLGLALFSTTYMLVLSRTGMEVALALCFTFLFWRRVLARPLELQDPAAAFATGLLASLLVLSRIDTLIGVLLYGLLLLLRPLVRRRMLLRPSIFFSLGLLPVALYAGLNWQLFHTVLPISGMAKNLRPIGLPSITTIWGLLKPNAQNLLFTWPSIGIALLYVRGLYLRSSMQHLAVGSNPAQPPATDRVLLAVLLQTIVFYLTLSFSSDWPIWTWYLYPMVPIAAMLGPSALTGAVGMRDASESSRAQTDGVRRTRATALLAAVTLLCFAVLLGLARLNPEAVAIYDAAVDLRAFAATHPGRYAMGDRAGTPGYLLHQPVLQLEGLVGDRAFLTRVERRENLLSALSDLHADYFVTASAKPDGACYRVREPAKAGPHSPVMLARICSAPVAHFDHLGYETLVFDLDAADPTMQQASQ